MMQVSRTAASRSASTACLTSMRSATASMTRPHGASAAYPFSPRAFVTCTRAMAASASAADNWPLSALRRIIWAQHFCASLTASGRASASSTVMPASAATWAMPRPMMPAPTIPIVTSEPSAISPSLERRRTFLDEGAHAFLLVLGVEHQLERLALERKRGVERKVTTGQHQLLDLAHGDRRQGRDGARQRQCAFHGLDIRHDLADEAHGLGLARRPRGAGGPRLRRLALAGRPSQPLGATGAATDAALDLALAELRALARHDDVRHQGELAAAAQRPAIDGGDQRLG